VSGPVVLALEGISKRFGTTDALVGASIAIRRGAIHALLGENGAGKTTLMRVAYGLVQPDHGVVRDRNGLPIRLATPAAAIRLGIGMVHQHFTTVHAMTVAENVALGGSGRFDRRATADRVREIGATIGVVLDPDALAGTLGVPAQQQLEIIKALSRDAELLILDEPTAVLAPAEVEQLLSRLRSLAGAGLGIVIITHKLREALAVADDVTVLRRGATVMSAPASACAEDDLATAMVGTGWSDDQNVVASTGTDSASRSVSVASRARPVVRTRGLAVLDGHGVRRVRDVDLEVYGGEIVGIAGVDGSGVHELLRALARRAPVVSGSLETPAQVGFVPEDRHRDAIALEFSLTENVALRGAGARRGLSRWHRLRDRTRSLLEDYDVRAPGPESAVGTLSGGNQQKLVLARELEGSPTLLVAENPTRGLDLRATAAIHARLRAERNRGMAIVLYSSDLDELLMLADRTAAMFGGALIAAPRDRQALGQAMLGAATSL